MSKDGITRKQILSGLIMLPALALTLGSPARAATKASRHYEDKSTHEGKECRGCRWFNAGKTAESEGTCSQVSGAINPKGWCEMWMKR
ncbi:MAG TPA: high-potential iron-sulfur protein [Verrucomicrobiae bacterium]|jgi:hypothetical protein|nr:high-potential iron-sulfur protein [Verrucomicrobiae bacterium]